MFVTVARLCVALAVLRHSTSRVLHIVRIAVTYCDVQRTCCTLCRQGSSAVWPQADLFVQFDEFPPTPSYTSNTKFPVCRIWIISILINDIVIKLLCELFSIECLHVCMSHVAKSSHAKGVTLQERVLVTLGRQTLHVMDKERMLKRITDWL